MKNSVTAVYKKACQIPKYFPSLSAEKTLAEKNLGELWPIIFLGQSLRSFWRKGEEQIENVKETAENFLNT